MIVSPTAALILLLQNKYFDKDKSALISSLLFVGRTEANKEIFDNLISEAESVFSVKVSSDIDFIQNDPVRRYFETHIANSVLQRKVPQLDFAFLENIHTKIKQTMVDSPRAEIKQIINRLEKAYQGLPSGTDTSDQYAESIASVRAEKNDDDSLFAQKLDLLLKSAFAATTSVLISDMQARDTGSKTFPINIYTDRTGPYAPDQRGVIKKIFGLKMITGKKLILKKHLILLREVF